MPPCWAPFVILVQPATKGLLMCSTSRLRRPLDVSCVAAITGFISAAFCPSLPGLLFHDSWARGAHVVPVHVDLLPSRQPRQCLYFQGLSAIAANGKSAFEPFCRRTTSRRCSSDVEAANMINPRAGQTSRPRGLSANRAGCRDKPTHRAAFPACTDRRELRLRFSARFVSFGTSTSGFTKLPSHVVRLAYRRKASRFPSTTPQAHHGTTRRMFICFQHLPRPV